MNQQEKDKPDREESQSNHQTTESAKAKASRREALLAQVSQEARDIDYERWDGMA